jgi:sialate O-acetylesterase
MEITTGLFEHMVLQRNEKNVTDSLVTGHCALSGDLTLKVTGAGKPAKGFARPVKIGKAANGSFKAALKGIPVGGPYTVELSITEKNGTVEKLAVKDVLVGDVWIAAGQSNMQGCGEIVDRARPHKLVRAFYMDDRWDIAQDPLHVLSNAVDFVHNQGNRVPGPAAPVKGVGPGVSFAQEMHKTTGVPQAVIACAHGGTSMAQWSPTLKDKAGHSLYGATLRRFHKNGARVKGIIWYQGESDSNDQAAPIYTQNMKDLIASFRKDMGSPNLPFVLVQISRVVNFSFFAKNWNKVQDQQRRLQGLIKNVATVPAIDLTLDDSIHVSGKSMHRLGVRLAQAMSTILGHKNAKPLPIEVDKVSLATHPGTGLADVLVSFRNVVGKLSAAGGRPVGFEVVDSEHVPAVFDVLFENRNTVRIKTSLTTEAFGDKCIVYGLGPNPVCNLLDDADRAVPVFGPLPIGEPRALTAFATSWEVSGFEEGHGDLSSLGYQKALGFARSKRSFSNRFIDLHLEMEPFKNQDKLVVFRTWFNNDEPMKLSANVGYDGPVKVWIDGQEVIHDPKGTNPAWEDKARARFNAKPGRHEVVIAFGTNFNRAWGIFFRLERMDVKPADLKTMPVGCKLPTFEG